MEHILLDYMNNESNVKEYKHILHVKSNASAGYWSNTMTALHLMELKKLSNEVA
jgi:hypothetical protein